MPSWTGAGAPNSGGAVGTFGSVIPAAAAVFVDAPKTAGVINFDSVNSYTVKGGFALTLASTTGTPTINVFAGSHLIGASVLSSQNVQFNALTPASSLTLLDFTLTAPTASITIGGAGVVS